MAPGSIEGLPKGGSSYPVPATAKPWQRLREPWFVGSIRTLLRPPSTVYGLWMTVVDLDDEWNRARIRRGKRTEARMEVLDGDDERDHGAREACSRSKTD